MRWTDIPFDPPRRMLRQFALGWLIFLVGVGLWQELLCEQRGMAVICLGLGLAGGGVGLAYPRVLRPLFVGLMVLVFPLGWVISHLVLALLFFGIFTPLAVLFRLCGRDLLARRFKPGYDSYWRPKPSAPEVQAYFRQS
jgi:hypothetical protein